jgi:hypothetical protein
MSRTHWLFLAAPLILAGCGGSGKVEQGRVIQFDRSRGLVTVILESGKARYDVLPPATVKVPANPAEMGPAPAAGELLWIDSVQRQLVSYDAAAGQLRTVSYSPVEESRGVSSNDSRVREGLPRVDRQNRTVTLYDPDARLLLTCSVSEADLNLPEDAWRAGDVVRYYFKQPGQALRMMNVTRTDLTRSGE